MKMGETAFVFLILPVIIIALGLMTIFNTKDYENARRVRDDVVSVLASSGICAGDHTHFENVVMVSERKHGLCVVIANPSPNAEEIYKIIYNKKSLIRGGDVEIIFKDKNMNIIKSKIIP